MLKANLRTKRLFSETQNRNKEIFWGEIAPAEHFVQFYNADELFLDTLESFVMAGLRKGDSVILIVTPAHAQALQLRLTEFKIDPSQLQDQLIFLDAKETLSKFMVNGWPDEQLFNQVVSELLQRAGKDGRRVRAFGEMVALLWADGHNGATVRLEHLWHEMCAMEKFSLFCAYPKSGFTENCASSIKEICAAHSKVIEEIEWLTPRKNSCAV
jgi:hypothetical protein